VAVRWVGDRSWVAVLVAALVIAADQLTKSWAISALDYGVPRHVFASLSWNLTINTGAAFGLGTGVTPILEVVAVLLITVLAVAARRAGRDAPLVAIVAIGLLLGGALSNLADRVFRSHHGGVVDFVDALRVGDHDRWPIFNLADASITVGAILLLVVGTCRRRLA
jgi:signal peptidase II